MINHSSKKDRYNREFQIPDEYLKKGYLDKNGNIYSELILEQAEVIGLGLSQNKNLTSSQLRRFFDHARSIETRLNIGIPFETLRSELDNMCPIALVAERRLKLRPFADVIKRMVSAVLTEMDFRKGFMQHFNAVYSYFYSKKG